MDERLKGELDSFLFAPYNRQLFVDKSSWLSLGNRSSGGAQWRAATCRLAEEEGGCQLNIYVEVCRFSGSVELRWPEILGFLLPFRF